MKILADANIESYLVDFLREQGHEVVWMNEIEPTLKDTEVLKIANKSKMTLLAHDKDFGEIIFFQKKITQSSVILLRLDGLTRQEIKEILISFFSEYLDLSQNTFTVITPKRIRTQTTEH